MLSPRALVMVAALFALGACDRGGAAAKSAADHDRPVPASEPREELALELDLEAASDCEERFDLALYQDRRVDLVAWDDGDGCMRRAVVIRYLSGKMGREELLEAVKDLARAVRPGESTRDTSGVSSSAPRGEAGRNEETK
jgi:hypothetical protein